MITRVTPETSRNFLPVTPCPDCGRMGAKDRPLVWLPATKEWIHWECLLKRRSKALADIGEPSK